MCTENVLVKKNVHKGAKHGLLPRAWIKNIVHGVKAHWLPNKENVQG